jgi:hypothetical protein
MPTLVEAEEVGRELRKRYWEQDKKKFLSSGTFALRCSL